MEILYILVILSLGFSLGFLIVFFWAVNKDQMSSLDTVSWSILDEDTKIIQTDEDTTND